VEIFVCNQTDISDMFKKGIKHNCNLSVLWTNIFFLPFLIANFKCMIIPLKYVDKQSCVEWTQRLRIGEMITVF